MTMTMTMTDESAQRVRINDHLGGFTLTYRAAAERDVARGLLARTDHPRIFRIVAERLDEEARAMEARLAARRKNRRRVA